MPSDLFLLIGALLILGSAVVALWLLRQWLRDERLLNSLELVLLEVTLPKDVPERKQKPGEGVREQIQVGLQWLTSLAGVQESGPWARFLYGAPTFAFEIVAHPDGEIIFFVAAPRRYEEFLEKQVFAYYPNADVRRVADYTLFEAGDAVRGGALKLAQKAYVPLKTYEQLPADPLQGITQALAKMERGDAAALQFVVRPAPPKVRRKGKRVARKVALGKQMSLTRQEGTIEKFAGSVGKQVRASTFGKPKEGAWGADREREGWLPQMSPVEQERLQRMDQKASEYQFEVTGRVVVSCKTAKAADAVYTAIQQSFTQFGEPGFNELKLKSRPDRGFFRDFIFRTDDPKARMVLSVSELLSLYHFPSPEIETPNIRWRKARRAPAPANLPQEGIILGVNEYRGVRTTVRLLRDDRRRHLYMLGQTGTGKTTLFKHLVLQDIRAGEGVGVVDPHGDLIEDVLLHIPPARAEDVVLFDPKDTERPLGLNMLEARDPNQRDLVVQELVLIIEKLATRLNPESVGPMFEHYLRNALLTLIEDPEATLIDVPRLFTDKSFREWVVSRVQNPVVRQFWEKEYAQSLRGQQSADMLSYVISKLGRFISNEVVRNIIGQPRSAFDVRDLMDNGKILLVNLSKGALGDINADLLGFVLVSKLQIAALSRTDVPPEQRRDFYLYLDEFQNFTTDTVGTILSEARKYRLNLNLTHQFVGQLTDPIRDAVFGNVGTVVSYRIGVEDTELMAKQFAPVFDEYDLLNVEKFNAFVRLLVNNEPQRPFSLSVPPPAPGGNERLREQIRELSRLTYGRPKADVDERVRQRLLEAGSAPLPSPSAFGTLSEPEPLR